MKYTALFEFNEAPNIKRSDGWLGGTLCTAAFFDVFAELERLQAKMELIQEWYDTDCSIYGITKIMEDEDD